MADTDLTKRQTRERSEFLLARDKDEKNMQQSRNWADFYVLILSSVGFSFIVCLLVNGSADVIIIKLNGLLFFISITGMLASFILSERAFGHAIKGLDATYLGRDASEADDKKAAICWWIRLLNGISLAGFLLGLACLLLVI